jgi:hypothetical protein
MTEVKRGRCSKAQRANFLKKMAEQTPAILFRRVALAPGAQGKNAQSHFRNVRVTWVKKWRARCMIRARFICPAQIHCVNCPY